MSLPWWETSPQNATLSITVSFTQGRGQLRIHSPPAPHEPHLYFIYIASLSAGMWLKPIGFAHNFIVFFGVRKTVNKPITLGGG